MNKLTLNNIGIACSNFLKFSKFLILLTPLLFIPNKSYSIDADGKIPIKIRYLHTITGKASGSPIKGANYLFVDDTQGELFILDTSMKRVLITDLEGIYIFSFSFSKSGVFSPSSMAVDKDGKIYFADIDKVVIADYDGTFIKKLDVSAVPGEGKFSFQSVAVDDKYLYLGEISRGGRVLVFDRETTEFVTEYKDGIGNNAKIGVDKDGLYLLDPATFAVYSIDKNGNPRGKFGKVSGLAGGFSMPSAIAVNKESGRVVVVDSNRAAVIFFDREGDFL